MHVTYTPEGGTAQRWDFNPGRVRAAEAELIEKRYGKAWDQFRADVQTGSMKARRVLLWHLLRREHHTLRFEDVPDFYTDELLVEHSVDELTLMREKLAQADLPDGDRDQMLAMLDIELAEAAARGEVPGGKALSNSAG
ncbi:hypothetical protein ACFYPX_18090 [Micromonospora zamorensis]|uniref:hypothetical protein n=1 Tax=Micromonospora zamorensis TaxID=709883 RepID=UPI0036800246